MPPAPPGSAYKVGLVGTGIHLVQAIESLRAIPGVTIAIVVDASDRSEGGKLAKSLQLPVVKNAMEVFKTDANFVLEVSGDERAYERLLSIKPPGVEVMSVRGARLFMDNLRKVGLFSDVDFVVTEAERIDQTRVVNFEVTASVKL